MRIATTPTCSFINVTDIDLNDVDINITDVERFKSDPGLDVVNRGLIDDQLADPVGDSSRT